MRPPTLVELEPWAYEFIDAIKPEAHGFAFEVHPTAGPWWVYLHGKPLRVTISGRTESDGRRWIHVCASHDDRLPTWDAMKRVHAAFIGEDRRAIQIFVPKSEWVSIHNFCLHLWHCLDGDGLPDFRVVEPDRTGI